MRKLSNTEAKLEKSVAYKKACILLVPLMISVAVGVKAHLIYLLFHQEFEVIFA